MSIWRTIARAKERLGWSDERWNEIGAIGVKIQTEKADKIKTRKEAKSNVA
jgi:hypothetical protein